MSGTDSRCQQHYAVIGSSVEKSLSPHIHSVFATSMGEQASYGRINVSDVDVSSSIHDFFNSGGVGLSVTMPFKELAYQLADQVHPRAQAVSAANTLTRLPNGNIAADNTDGLGFFVAIHHMLGWSWQRKRVLLIGAGGAARAVLPMLLRGQPLSLCVVNRSVDRAQRMVRDSFYHQPKAQVQVRSLDDLPEQAYDCVINTVGAGLSGDDLGLSKKLFSDTTCVYDLSYGERAQPFLDWCETQGALVSDGLLMLIVQAAYQHFIWHGVMPDLSEESIGMIKRESLRGQ